MVFKWLSGLSRPAQSGSAAASIAHVLQKTYSHTTMGQLMNEHGLAVQLLADTEGEVCGKYGVWQDKEKDGVKRMGIVRSTFVIDKHGILRHALYGVNARGHAAEVLKLIKEMK